LRLIIGCLDRGEIFLGKSERCADLHGNVVEVLDRRERCGQPFE